jgi:hypothetical protein
MSKRRKARKAAKPRPNRKPFLIGFILGALFL